MAHMYENPLYRPRGLWHDRRRRREHPLFRDFRAWRDDYTERQIAQHERDLAALEEMARWRGYNSGGTTGGTFSTEPDEAGSGGHLTDTADSGGKFGCVRCGGVVGGQPEFKSGHVMIKVYPGEYVLTERQAADAKKAGAKLPEWGFQKDELPKHISRNVKADRGGRHDARVHGRPPPLATPSTWLDYSRRYNEM